MVKSAEVFWVIQGDPEVFSKESYGASLDDV
jgi:hypothetical protein